MSVKNQSDQKYDIGGEFEIYVTSQNVEFNHNKLVIDENLILASL